MRPDQCFIEYLVGEGTLADDISTVESLQYEFSTIRAAINNFSNDSKLGESGFGPVYKVISNKACLMKKNHKKDAT